MKKLKLSNNLLLKLQELDFRLLGCISIVAFIGFVMMYSAAQGSIDPWASKQLYHFVLGMTILFAVSMSSIKIWYNFSYIIYFVSLILLVLTELTGYTAMGATRWFKLGPLKIQPAEIMKIALVLALARYFHNTTSVNVKKIRYIIAPLLLVVVPAALILKQPDLGTAFILIAVGGMMFFTAGVSYWKFITVIVSGVLSMPVIWGLMYDYQKQRVLVFLNPEQDKLASGYNIIQSKIAIGSGGVWGKGLLQGSQSQLSFLPEHQTDFIFTMLSEELGFIGAIFIMIMYSMIIFYSYKAVMQSNTQFGSLMSVGIISIFFLHVFINIAMIMGIIPAVGVPLPLLTYGGTIMISILFGFGLIMCAKSRSFK